MDAIGVGRLEQCVPWGAGTWRGVSSGTNRLLTPASCAAVRNDGIAAYPQFEMTASRDSGIAANRRLGIPAFRGGAKKRIGEPGSSPICFFDFACRDLPQGRGGHAKTPHARCGFQSAVRSVSGGVILPLSPFLRSSSEGCKRNSGESHRCGVTGQWMTKTWRICSRI